MAVVPKHRVNRTRFHGVFAPNSKRRASVTAAKRGKGAKPKLSEEGRESAGATPSRDDLGAAAATRLRHRHRDLSDLRCGGALRIIACIEDAWVIEKIPTHPENKYAFPSAEASRSPPVGRHRKSRCSTEPPRVPRAAATWMGAAGQRSA
jgi:hypothetical protein